MTTGHDDDEEAASLGLGKRVVLSMSLAELNYTFQPL